MGLHLEIIDAVSTHQKLLRAQAWYSLYNLEIALMEITGRPGSIALSDMTTPIDGLEQDIETDEERSDRFSRIPQQPSFQPILPRPKLSASDPPRSLHLPRSPSYPLIAQYSLRSTFLTYRIRLSTISHRISSTIYTGGHDMSWSDLQDHIRHFQVRLQQFLVDLPGGLSFGAKPSAPMAASLSRIELELYYWSLQITLHRPCLIAVSGQSENDSSKPRSFHEKAALTCVEAALSMIAFLPPQPEAAQIYQTLPWWNLLHFLCQAAAVLTIELCFNAVHCPSQLIDIVEALKISLSYLRCMSAGSLSVYKAWRIFRQLLMDATSRLDIDVSDVLHEAHRPAGWTAELENSLLRSLDHKGRR